MTKNSKACAFILLCSVLTSCSDYSTTFDCPIGKGLPCTPLSAVNAKIDRKELDLSFPEGKQEEPSFLSGISSSCSDCSSSFRAFSSHSSIKVHWRSCS